MDFCRNTSLAAGEFQQPEQTLSSNLDDLFSNHNTEADVSLEWLSVFVEDCLSSSGNCLPPVAASTNPKTTTTDPKPPNPSKPLHKTVVPGKARSKRKKRSNNSNFMSWTKQINPKNQNLHQGPLLLQQAYWLADSELILPQKEEESSNHNKKMMMTKNEHDNVGVGVGVGVEGFEVSVVGNGGLGRRCTHCLSQRTPQWRAGPLGPKTLCNACGVRFKSGRLLPEYRPAKSPTFVSYLHSNSHKKVLEMRNVGVSI